MSKLVLDIHSVCSDLAVLVSQVSSIFSNVECDPTEHHCVPVSGQTEGPDESLDSPSPRASDSQASWG